MAKVESVFTISGRGAVVVPVWLSDLKVKVGDAVQLRSADGKIRDTRIAGVELLKPLSGSCRAAFLLARDVASYEITEGTEIWLAEVARPNSRAEVETP